MACRRLVRVRNLSKIENENVLPKRVGVRGFESHLPHQKTNAPQLLVPSGFCLSPTLAHGDPPKVIGKSFWKPLSVRAGFRAFFSRRVRYQLVRDFLTPEESPGNKRGNQCSKNRLPRIEIWADYQFVLADQPLKLLIRMSGTAPIWEAPPSPNHGQQRTLVTSNFKKWVN